MGEKEGERGKMKTQVKRRVMNWLRVRRVMVARDHKEYNVPGWAASSP